MNSNACKLKKHSWHSYIIVVLCLYLYLHSPYIPYLPFAVGSVKLLYLPMLLMLFSYLKSFRYFRKTFKAEYLILWFVLLFVVLRTIGGGENVISFYISALIEIFFLPWFIILVLFKNGFRRIDDIFYLLLIVGAVGAIISTLAFVSPTLNNYIRDSFLYLKSGHGLDTKLWRGFGLSSALTSHYSYIQASIVVLYFFYAKKNKWFVFALPFMLLSIIFNARTGVLILVLGLLIRLFSNFSLKITFMLTMVLAIIIPNIENFFSFMGASDESVLWLNSFVEEISLLSDSDMLNNGVVYTLLEQMVVWPSTINEWIWGRGYSLFGKLDELGIQSDIGFINVLSYGGIIYSAVLYSLIIVGCIKLKQYKENWFMIFFIAVFIIINIKSTYLPLSGELRFMMLIYYFLILYDKSKLTGYPFLNIHK